MSPFEADHSRFLVIFCIEYFNNLGFTTEPQRLAKEYIHQQNQSKSDSLDLTQQAGEKQTTLIKRKSNGNSTVSEHLSQVGTFRLQSQEHQEVEEPQSSDESNFKKIINLEANNQLFKILRRITC